VIEIWFLILETARAGWNLVDSVVEVDMTEVDKGGEER
jgi:hypothetical protein